MGHVETDQYNKDKRNAPKLFPLSPDSTLKDAERLPQMRVYHKYLRAAFDEPRIFNIAITGGFGIGKSSVVRSLERSLYKKEMTHDTQVSIKKKLHCKKTTASSCEDIGFLYISLGSFTSTSDRDQSGGEDQDEAEKNNNQELNVIERRLLLQIYARFHRKDLPLSSFRLIPEDSKRHRKIATLCSLITCAIFLLLFHEVLGRLLVGLSTVSSSQWLAPLHWVLCVLVIWKPYIHLLLYIFIIVVASLTAGRICFLLLPRLHLNSISLKSDNVEVALEKEACESYLDLYSMELVYCLEQLVDKIDGTIVFEDFDRFSPDVCIQIFTRLREINYLANLRLKKVGKRIRFIYVINDGLLGDIIHPKFFDYVLSIIPYLNRRSSETVLNERLNEINKAVGFEENCVRHMESIISKVAPYLADFRLQNTILNEYGLLSELYKAHNAERLDEYDAAQLFAFAIYKNIWPDDYHDFLLGRSQIFLNDVPQYPDSMENLELLNLLTDKNIPMLTSRCLYYAGFSEQRVADMRKMRWERADSKEIIRDIETIQAIDHDNLNLVREFCSSTDDIEIVAAAIRCMVCCKQTDNSWFFVKRKLKNCLRVLAKMKDEDVKSQFFELTAAEDPKNMYNATPEKISELFKITDAELIELCRGVQQFSGDICLMIEGVETNLSEQNSMVRQARAKIQGQKKVSQ